MLEEKSLDSLSELENTLFINLSQFNATELLMPKTISVFTNTKAVNFNIMPITLSIFVFIIIIINIIIIISSQHIHVLAQQQQQQQRQQ